MTRNKPGRPRLDDDDPSVYVGLTLPSKKYDAYCKRAREEDISVPEVIRRDIESAGREGKLRK
jgi:hypothetical protein